MDQDTIITRAAPAAAGSGLLEGLFLVGSFGRNSADQWSDVDFLGLAPAAHHDAVIAWWRHWLDAQESLIYFKVHQRGGTLANAITSSWLRVDIHLPADGLLGSRAQDGIKALYDPHNLCADLPGTLPDHQPDPQRIEDMLLEFIRILGLTPVTLGRREYVTMVMGTGLLRDILIQLMQEELPLTDRGGILHLNTLLPQSDIAMLEALPYPRAEQASLIEAQLALARAFFPRARQMADRLGIACPAAFETSARQHLAEAIGRSPTTLWAAGNEPKMNTPLGPGSRGPV